jgi:hypothetical protein
MTFFVCWYERGFNKSYHDQPGIIITQCPPSYAHILGTFPTIYKARQFKKIQYEHTAPPQCHPICLIMHHEYGIGCERHYGTFTDTDLSIRDTMSGIPLQR